MKVKRTHIATTETVVFSVWESNAGHTAVTTIDDRWMGRVGSRKLPADLDALPPCTHRRMNAVQAWHEAQYREAYDAILAEYPEAIEGDRDMGEIRLHTGDDPWSVEWRRVNRETWEREDRIRRAGE